MRTIDGTEEYDRTLTNGSVIPNTPPPHKLTSNVAENWSSANDTLQEENITDSFSLPFGKGYKDKNFTVSRENQTINIPSYMDGTEDIVETTIVSKNENGSTQKLIQERSRDKTDTTAENASITTDVPRSKSGVLISKGVPLTVTGLPHRKWILQPYMQADEGGKQMARSSLDTAEEEGSGEI